MTKYFKNLTQKKVKTAPPRDAEVLKKEYADLTYKAGDYQYQAYVLARSLEQVNQQLEQIATEFNERAKLDKANEPKKEETKEQAV